jgi:hypothetical protein
VFHAAMAEDFGFLNGPRIPQLKQYTVLFPTLKSCDPSGLCSRVPQNGHGFNASLIYSSTNVRIRPGCLNSVSAITQDTARMCRAFIAPPVMGGVDASG